MMRCHGVVRLGLVWSGVVMVLQREVGSSEGMAERSVVQCW